MFGGQLLVLGAAVSCVPPLHVHLERQTVTLFRSEVLQM